MSIGISCDHVKMWFEESLKSVNQKVVIIRQNKSRAFHGNSSFRMWGQAAFLISDPLHLDCLSAFRLTDTSATSFLIPAKAFPSIECLKSLSAPTLRFLSLAGLNGLKSLRRPTSGALECLSTPADSSVQGNGHQSPCPYPKQTGE